MMDRLQSPVHPKCRSQTRKFDRGLMHLHHTEWHWLDVPERVQYKLGVAVHRCMQRKTPQYLVECCAPSSDIASRQCLRSASRRQLDVPRHYRSKLKWSSGLPRRRPRHLELSTSSPPWSVAEFWLHQAGSENQSIHRVPVTLAH